MEAKSMLIWSLTTLMLHIGKVLAWAAEGGDPRSVDVEGHDVGGEVQTGGSESGN